MSIRATVQLQIELTEREYEVIMAFRALDSVRQEAIMRRLEQVTPPPVRGIAGKVLAERLERWRQDLTEDDQRELREALETLESLEPVVSP
jgi:hypothetical protein